MDKMIALFSGFNLLSAEEIELIRTMITPVHFPAGQLFRPADRSHGNGITFLNKGVVLTGSPQSANGNEDRANILIDAGNLLAHENISPVSAKVMQSLTAVELMVLDGKRCAILSFLIPRWDKVMDLLQIMALTAQLERFKNQTTGSARFRYLNLIEYYPAIARQVPLRQIAYFLGITSQSLSRIRNDLAHKR